VLSTTDYNDDLIYLDFWILYEVSIEIHFRNKTLRRLEALQCREADTIPLEGSHGQ